jgi:hypothetical protein
VTTQLQTGSNVTEKPTSAVNLNFTTVSTPGTVQVASSTGPGAEVTIATGAGFKTVPGTSYDVTSNAETGGLTTVCIAYNPANLSVSESILRLLYNNGSAWQDITTSVDTLNQRVCGKTLAVSSFIIGYRKTLKPGDLDGSGAITIDEVQKVINGYLGL